MSDAERIAKALEKAKMPDWVESTRVEPMVDHTGEPALRVTVVVRAGREDVVKDGEAVSDVARKIHLVVDGVGVALFPYTRFVGASEAA